MPNTTPKTTTAHAFTPGEAAREGEQVFLRLPADARRDVSDLLALVWQASTLSACVADSTRLAEAEKAARETPGQTTADALRFIDRHSDRYRAADQLATLLSDADTVASRISI